MTRRCGGCYNKVSKITKIKEKRGLYTRKIYR